MNDLYKEGIAIVDELKSAGVRRPDMAMVIGKKPSTISNKYNGFIPFKKEEIEKLKQYLDTISKGNSNETSS